MRRPDSCGDPFRHPVEKPVQVQVSDQQHHRKQQHNRAEIDEVQRVPWRHRAERHHQHRSDDGRAWTVDFHSRKFPERENHIAAEKNCVGGEARYFAQGCGRERQEPMITRDFATGNCATKMACATRTKKPIRSFSASCYGSPSARLLQYRPVSDWRQIQARIRKARTSADPPGQLSALYERTHDAMVAFELAQLFEKAGTVPDAIRWFTTAAERFRRPQWKQKAEEGLVRLGAPVPVASEAVPGAAVSETTSEPMPRL